MGKPRLIILIRHAQSEGNKNRAVHQTIPDHRVPLTKEGEKQALEAGDKLASLLRPDDTLQIITSPYTRTRQTTQGILASSLQNHPHANCIRVYEEPRIREQDFGNYQPSEQRMTEMWHERAAYGHFFYRIPNGESAADAYDRVAGFNETLYRQFADDDFPSVLVLVTHGLMTRIFLMKWYHYSVEYFEDLRNVNHCEFVFMEKDPSTEKYSLQTKLRTWTGYAREKEENRYRCPPVLKSAPHGANSPTGCLTCQQTRLRPKSVVIRAGRDFGGSRSGAGSMAGSDNESDGDSGDDPCATTTNSYKSTDPSDMLERVQKAVVDGKGETEVLGDGGMVSPGLE